ncbi:MAG: hypothetical protein H7123_04490 [Thermoleophilia bacterium]|nr:hypothetical protein [Thermoleophilia bacterium]
MTDAAHAAPGGLELIGSMGNDITPPHEAATGAAAIAATDKPVRDKRHWLAPAPIGSAAPPMPPPQFGEIAKFRDLEPLDAARHYGRESLLLADRARWEAGVALEAAQRGNHSFAAEVSVTATRHASAARFLAALMTSAVDSWGAQHAGRATSLGIDQLVARVRREVDNAIEVSDAAGNDVDMTMTQDARD